MSRRIRFHLTMALGIALVVFGLACLNYTAAAGREHHTQFAAQHALPAPSKPIQYGGLVAMVLGAGLAGYGIGNRRAISSEMETN